MRRLILLALLLSVPLSARQVPLDLEIAQDPAHITMGLMGRSDLLEDHGMLFIFDQDRPRQFWMFNCYMDLDIAGIDAKGVVRQIRTMRAYPSMMDSSRPINSIEDLADYPFDDPICLFFQRRSTTVSGCYVLEVEAGWFKNHGIGPGATLNWNPSTGKALFEVH